MYKVIHKEPELSPDKILQNITQEELWSHYLGFKPKSGELFLSPVRDEDSPSANLFYTNDGNLILKDFGGDCFNIWQFLQAKYRLNFREALKKVYYEHATTNKEFDYKSVIKTLKINKDSIHTVIQIKRRDWNQDDYNYWWQYYIPIKLLQEYNISPISHYWINGNIFTPTLITYAYNFGNGLRKLYSPLAKKAERWYSNVPSDIYSGYDQLEFFDNLLIITKAMKEVLLWRVLGYNAIAPQSECKLSLNLINKLKHRFKEIIISFDGDETGRKYSSMNNELYGLREIFMPEEKNITDFIYTYGIDSLKQFLKEVKL